MQKSINFSACQLQAGVAEFGATRSREEQVDPGVFDTGRVRLVRRGHSFLPFHHTDWTEWLGIGQGRD